MRQITPFETHRTIALFVSEMLKAPGTRKNIAERTGLTRNYVSRLLIALKEKNACYVIDWESDTTGRYQQAVFSLGSGEDKPRPPRKTQAERDAKFYRKKKQAMQAKEVKTSIIGGGLWA